MKSFCSIFLNALIAVALFGMSFVSCSVSGDYSERMASSEIARSPEASHINGLGGKLKFNYTTGLVLKSFLDLYEVNSNEDLLDYVDAWYDAIVNDEGEIQTYSVSEYSVDRVSPARTLLKLYSYRPREKYRKALDLVRSQIDTHPRTLDGCFWHKNIYPRQIWLDGLYMLQPFYIEYTARFTADSLKTACYEDICNCFVVAAKHTYDAATHLYRHAWDESCSMFWCNPSTGQSDHCWGRALGWYSMALVDVLETMPEDVRGRENLINILRGICNTIPDFADSKTGMWYQVMDCPGKEGNYVESTCSAMFIYTYLKASRLGFIDSKWNEYGRKAYKKMIRTFIRKDDSEGHISLTDCCEVAGLGGKENRRGDYAYYINTNICDNDPKGVGPFIMASLEYEK